MPGPRYAHSVISTLELAVQRRSAGRGWMLGGLLLGSLAGLVLAAPATWLAGAINQASNGRLLLADARGTVWDGSAVTVLTGGAGSRDAAALPDRLHWRLRPAWRGLSLGLRQDCCLRETLDIALNLGWSGLSLRLGQGPEAGAPANAAAPADGGRVLGQWPMAWLAGLGAPFNTLGLGGQLQLASNGLSVDLVAGRLRLGGALRAELRDASSRAAQLPVLGSYQMDLHGAPGGGDTALFAVRTLSGALRVEAQGQWSGARLRVRGTANAAEGQETALSNLLSLLGRRQGAAAVLSIG